MEECSLDLNFLKIRVRPFFSGGERGHFSNSLKLEKKSDKVITSIFCNHQHVSKS